jgi:hypothetical protein
VKGSVWQLPDGQWRIRWRQDGRRPSETYRLKDEAERALRKHIDDAQRGAALVDRRTTLRDFLPEWEAATKDSVKPRSWEAYDLHVRRYIRPRLGTLRLVEIDARQSQRFVDGLSRTGLSPKTFGVCTGR